MSATRQALLTLVLMSQTACPASLSYVITELRHPSASPGALSFATVIKDDGQVGGSAAYDATHGSACIWSSTGFTALPNLPTFGTDSTLYGIAKDGTACGSLFGNFPGRRAGHWAGGTVTSIGSLPGYPSDVVAWGMNDFGTIVGHSYNSTIQRSHAFAYKDGVMQDLGSLPGPRDESLAYDVNNQGVVVGYSYAQDGWRAFRWQNGVLEDIGLPLSFTDAFAQKVNESGTIGCSVNNLTLYRGAILRNGVWTVFGDDSGFATVFCWGLNDLDQTVGPMDTATLREPYLWDERYGTLHLKALTTNIANWSNVAPLDVNNKGQVTGIGYYLYDEQQGLKRRSGFRLDPVTTTVPPTTVTVVYGKRAAGDAQSLAALDGASLRVCRFLVPNQSLDPVQVRVEATLPWRPMNLWLKASARAVNSGSYSWSLNLYDWERGLFDPATNVTAPLTTSVSSQETIAKGRIDRYVRASDNKVWGLLRVRSTGPVSTTLWCAEFDQAVWEAVPLP